MARRSFEDIMRAAGAAAAKLRREHLPAPSKTPLTLELGPAELEAIDAWILGQPEPKPSREEAALRLLKDALARR